MFDFRHIPISFLIPWPAMVLMAVGCLATLGALGFGAWWVISHLRWV